MRLVYVACFSFLAAGVLVLAGCETKSRTVKPSGMGGHFRSERGKAGGTMTPLPGQKYPPSKGSQKP